MKGDIVLARVLGAHGLKGGVALRVFCEDPKTLLAHEFPIGKILSITPGVKGAWNVVIDGVADRTQAEQLKGHEFTITRDALPDAASDEYYIADLIGLTVLSDGAAIGKVADVQDFGAGILLDIKLNEGRSFFLPFQNAYVGDVNLPARTVTILEYAAFL